MSTDVDTENRLAEIRRERLQLQLQREQAADAAAAAEELAQAEQALKDERALLAAEAEHGPVGKALELVTTDRGTIVLKRSTAARFRRFQDQGKYDAESVWALVRHCIVHPSQAEVETLLDEQPAVLAMLASAVVRLAGMRSEELAKK